MGWATVVWKVVYLAVAAVVTLVVDRGVTRVARRVLDASSIPSASIFVNIIRGVIWAFGLLSVLEPVFGIKATAFVAALGVTSVVLSFGLQDTVSNVFSGLGLMLGKVVQPGDYVSVGGFEGFVTDVNWRRERGGQAPGDGGLGRACGRRVRGGRDVFRLRRVRYPRHGVAARETGRGVWCGSGPRHARAAGEAVARGRGRRAGVKNEGRGARFAADGERT